MRACARVLRVEGCLLMKIADETWIARPSIPLRKHIVTLKHMIHVYGRMTTAQSLRFAVGAQSEHPVQDIFAKLGTHQAKWSFTKSVCFCGCFKATLPRVHDMIEIVICLQLFASHPENPCILLQPYV